MFVSSRLMSIKYRLFVRKNKTKFEIGNSLLAEELPSAVNGGAHLSCCWGGCDVVSMSVCAYDRATACGRQSVSWSTGWLVWLNRLIVRSRDNPKNEFNELIKWCKKYQKSIKVMSNVWILHNLNNYRYFGWLESLRIYS